MISCTLSKKGIWFQMLKSRSRALSCRGFCNCDADCQQSYFNFCGAKDDGLNHNEHKYFGETLMIIFNYK